MKKLLLISLLIIILLSGCSLNNKRPVDKLKYPPLPEIQVPEVITHTLSNGMKVYLLADNKLPLVRVTAQAHGGSVTDPKSKIGLADLAAGAIVASSEKYSADEIKQITTDNAISLYGTTSSRHSLIHLDYLIEDQDLALDIFSDVMINPSFDEQEFETAKTRTISSIYRRNDNASTIAFREFQKVIYGEDYPFNYQTELYTIDNISLADVRDFYDTYFYPKNITLTLQGHFETDAMISKLEELFSSWVSDKDYMDIQVAKPEVENDANVYVVDKQDATQTWVLIGHQSNLLLKDDDYAPMVLLNEILGGGFNSRVYKSVRVKKGLSYSPAAFLSASYQDPGALYLLAPTATENTIEASNALVEEIRILTSEKVTKEELQFAKDSYFNSFVFRYERPDYTLNSIKNYDYYGYDRNFANILKENIEDVTIDDIYRVAKKYLKPEDLVYLFVGNSNEFMDDISELGQVEFIDISIKERPEGEFLDYVKGKEIFSSFLNKVKSKTPIKSFISTSTITSATPMGDISMDKDTKIVFPDKIKDVIMSPMGEISTIINGKDGVQNVSGRSIPIDKSQITAMLNQIKLTYFGWLNDPSHLTIGFLREESRENQEYKVLKIEHKGSSVEVWFNKDSNLPEFSFETMETQQGVMKIQSTFSNYQTHQGVTCPMQIETTLSDGSPINSTEYKSIKFNPEISSNDFDF